MDHVDRFFRHPCKARLVDLFPNAKEVSESMGAWLAILRHLSHLGRGDASVSAVVVGDGHAPRTGALIAMSTAWSVTSIDPVLRPKYAKLHPRLRVVSARVEDTPLVRYPGEVVIVTVHSHAVLADALGRVRGCTALHAVAIPCCVPQTVPEMAPTLEYEDAAILSPERTVRVWRGIPREALVDVDV